MGWVGEESEELEVGNLMEAIICVGAAVCTGARGDDELGVTRESEELCST
jgi:hypothetical protein